MEQSSKKGLLKTLENHFAAAAMTEADLETAREFLLRTESSTKRESVSSLRKTVAAFLKGFENHFAAVAMAEGSPEMAKEFLKSDRATQQSPVANKIKHLIKTFEDTFAAAAMAEGSQDMARDYLRIKSPGLQKPLLTDFLQTVGLKGVRVQYRVAVV